MSIVYIEVRWTRLDHWIWHWK